MEVYEIYSEYLKEPVYFSSSFEEVKSILNKFSKEEMECMGFCMRIRKKFADGSIRVEVF